MASVTALAECRYYRNSDKIKTVDLSEQQLVERVYDRSGCEGGWFSEAIEWIEINGQTKDSNIPYAGIYSGVCTKPSADFIVKGWIQIDQNVNTIKNALITYGVLSIAG